MEWRIVYFGTKGGGSQLADALLECFRDNSVGIVSDRNREILSENVTRIEKIPSGVIENLIFLLNFRARSKLVSEILSEIGGYKCIFVMPHPIDKYVKRKLNQRDHWTIIHDVIKHKSDLWPTQRSIKELVLRNNQLIFLSMYVRTQSLRNFGRTGDVLPLISPKRTNIAWEERRYDLSILGRHKKYKNQRLGLQVLSEVEQSLNVFISKEKSRDFRKELIGLHKQTIESGWLSIDRFIEVLAKTKVLLLTHNEASQSGLISMANSLGTYVIAPNIGGLPEQIIPEITGKIIESNSVDSYVDAIQKLLRKSECAPVVDYFQIWQHWSQEQEIKREK